MKVTSIIVFLISVVAARHHHRTLLETILKSRGNLYTKVNNDVQNVINNLFEAINLEMNFHNNSRIKLLLTMHYDLKSIAEKNFDVYEKIVEAAKPNSHTSTNKIKLFELIEEMIDDERFNLSGILNGKKHSRKHTKHKTTTTMTSISSYENMTDSVSDFADSLEFMEFIHDFIKKVDNLTEKDVLKQSSISPSDEENNESESDLKVWQPPRVLELDYVNDTNSRRIFMGKRTKIKSFPFIVSIHLMGIFSCAGSIISDDLVITAASCLQLLYNNRFYRENPRALVVRIGSNYYARGGEKIDIIETYFHPMYEPKTLANNLVILRLKTIIKFRRSKTQVRRIDLDKSAQHLPTNTEGILVVGWGSRKQSHIIDQFAKLLVAQLDIYDLRECAETYNKLYVSDKHFCAGFISSGGGACNKDLGGPGIVSGTLVGVISFGAPVCGAVDSPTVFIKLGFYADWIETIMEMPTIRRGVRSTLAVLKPQTPFVIDTRPTRRQSVTPVTTSTTTENDDMFTLQSVLNELSKANNSYLQDILYEDNDQILRTSMNFGPIRSPLANKTSFTTPGIHKFEQENFEYAASLQMIPTQSPVTRKFSNPTGTTLPSSYVPTKSKGGYTDLDLVDMLSSMNMYEQYNTSNVELQTQEAPKAYYDSYEADNKAESGMRAAEVHNAPKRAPQSIYRAETPRTPVLSKKRKMKSHHHHHHHHRHHADGTRDFSTTKLVATTPGNHHENNNNVF